MNTVNRLKPSDTPLGGLPGMLSCAVKLSMDSKISSSMSRKTILILSTVLLKVRPCASSGDTMLKSTSRMAAAKSQNKTGNHGVTTESLKSNKHINDYYTYIDQNDIASIKDMDLAL